MFSCEFCEILKNAFFTEQFRWLVLLGFLLLTRVLCWFDRVFYDVLYEIKYLRMDQVKFVKVALKKLDVVWSVKTKHINMELFNSCVRKILVCQFCLSRL